VKRKEKNENIEMLKGIIFFENWSLMKILRISALLNVQNYAKGSVIYEKNSTAACIYFVKEGRVDLYAYVPIEQHNKWPMGVNQWRIHQVNRQYLVKVAKLTKTQYFGEAEIKDAGFRTLKAVARDNCTCLVLNREHFLELFSDFEIESFILMGAVKVPSLEELQGKVIKGLNEKLNTKNAILDALKVNFVSLQGRESLLDQKTKRLAPWLNGYKLRRTESDQTFKKKIVFENRRNISVSKIKKIGIVEH
jgi:CRP-like cAMP-binding protein